MRQLSALLIALLPLAAGAECYMRSASVNDVKASITRIADVKRYVTPADKGLSKCIVTFRAEINHVWHTAESQSIGEFDQVCAQALNSGTGDILEKIAGSKIRVEKEMICTDRPDPEVKKTVKVDDIVTLSELIINPSKPNIFPYKMKSGSTVQCRYFVEHDFNPVTRNIFENEGIVCLLRKGEWQVVDKWSNDN